MVSMIKNFFRKQRHKRYVERYLSDLRWDCINTVVSASATGFHNGTDQHLDAIGCLIRKYERRIRLLKF